MSRDFEYEIRDAVVDLADEGRSVNLAAAAIRDGRHIVRRRRAVSAAATLVVLAILVVPFTLNHPAKQTVQPGAAQAPSTSAPVPTSQAPAAPVPVPAATTPPTVVDPLQGLVALPDGMVYASIPLTDGDSLVYNRSTGLYVKLPFREAAPSPKGATAAVNDGRRVGLVNLESGGVQWTTGPVPATPLFDWSPDGTRLTYLTRGAKSGTVRVSVLSVDRFSAASVGSDIPCSANCELAWLPDGQAIAVSGMDGKLSIRLVNPSTGNPEKGLERVTGTLSGSHGITDDRALAVTQIGKDAVVTVTATGEVILRLSADAAQAYWAGGHELLVVSSDGVVLYSLTGETVSTYPFPTGTSVKGPLPTLMHG